jgi:CHAT domain-containing protein/tetratricopeptide (TPR) repeat protein
MRQSLKSLSLITITLLLSLASPLQAARATSKLSSVLAQVPTPQNHKAAPNVEGTWTITEGKALDGRNYKGTVAIQPIGQIYELSWQTSAGKQSGIGFFEDGHFFVGWGTDAAAGYGVVLYKIGKDGTLEGKWAEAKSGGEIGTEIVTGGKPNQIEGDYQVTGTNPNENGRYKGTLNIRKTGDTYQVTWAVGSSYRGVGIRSGDWLVVSWGQSEQLGVADYTISGDKASGRLARFNQSSLGVENLVRTQASANLLPSCTPAQTPTTQSRKAEADCFLEQEIKLIDSKRFQAALQSLQQALTIYKELKDRQGEGQVLKRLGDAYYAQKDYKKAIEFQQQALVVAREIRDRELEGRALNNLGLAYKELGDSAKAIEYYQQALAIAREIHNSKLEQIALNNLGFIYTALKNPAKAVEYYQQVLAIAKRCCEAQIAQETQNHDLEWSALTSIVSAYDSLKDNQKIIEFAQQALTLARKTQNREWERLALNTLIGAYTSLGDFQKVVEYRQQLLPIARETKDRQNEGKVLIDIGLAYDALKNYQQAITSYQQSLAIAQEISDRVTEGWSLNNLGWIYQQQGDYNQAFDYYQRSLAIAKAIPDTQMQVQVLTNLGNAYSASGNYSKAIEYSQQLLATSIENKDRASEVIALLLLSETHVALGNSQKAVELAQQSLVIARKVKNRDLEAAALIDLSNAYWSLKDFHKVIEFAQESFSISRKIKNHNLEVTALYNLSNAYWWLRDYQKALEFAQESLSIAQEIKDRSAELVALHNLGANYIYLGDYQKATELFQQELALAREIKNHDYEGIALAHLSFTYFAQGDSKKIIEYGQQALKIGQENKSSMAEFFGLLTLSNGYSNLGNNEKALEFAQASLVIARDPKFRTSNFQELALDILGTLYTKVGRKEQAIAVYRESLAIDNNSFTAKVGLARIYRELNMPATSITYYKQAVSNIEQIRGKLPGLDRQLQESFLQAIIVGAEKTKNADIYRELADLLLSQGRILEAQQVLELLKIQELRDFTRNTRAGGKKNEVALNQTEEQIKKENGTLIAFGQRVYECQQTRCNQLSQLLDQRDALTEQYHQKIQTIEKQVRDLRSKDDAFFDPKKQAKAKEIVEAQPGTVLIYPLVLDDKIWLLWASKGGIIKTVEVSQVGQKQLAETVLKFRQLLQTPSSNIAELQATGKQLYDWLIKPIEPELKENKIQNLVFSLDRATRYIPMSALFDGKKYLIENYAVSTVLSADLTNTSDRIPPGTQNTSVLALGLSNAVPGFNPLPNVPAELDAIVRKQPNDTKGIYPGLEFLNKDFDWRSLRDNLLGHKLLHIATHGEFVPGSPDASYLLLGTGEKLSIPKIATLQDLGNISLVVLSACQTALAGSGQDGNEINGISYYFLNAGAKAVMASLWSVNDDSTRLLMQNFYGNLSKGTATALLTKAEALRQAQLSLLGGNSAKTGHTEQRSSLGPTPRTESQTPSTNRTSPGFSHPYYWAPFILIGNGL